MIARANVLPSRDVIAQSLSNCFDKETEMPAQKCADTALTNFATLSCSPPAFALREEIRSDGRSRAV